MRRQAIFAPIADFERIGAGDIHITNVDVGLLVRRLILFDKVILRSIRFRELPALVKAFGVSGLCRLLDEGLLSFFCDQLYAVTDIATNGVRQLPQFHFNIGIARAAGPEDRLRKEFIALQAISGLKNNQRAAIEEAAWNSQIRYPSEFGDLLLKQIDADFRPNSNVLKSGMLEQLRRLSLPADSSSYDFDLQIEETGPRIFRIQAPFGQHFGLAQEKVHEIVQCGVNSAANLNQRLLVSRAE